MKKKTKKKELLISIGNFNYFIEYELEDYCISFTIYEDDDEEEYINGIIKFDGCSNIIFSDGGYMHLCGYNSFTNLSKVLKAVWDKAEKEIKNWDKNCAYL